MIISVCVILMIYQIFTTGAVRCWISGSQETVQPIVRDRKYICKSKYMYRSNVKVLQNSCCYLHCFVLNLASTWIPHCNCGPFRAL